MLRAGVFLDGAAGEQCVSLAGLGEGEPSGDPRAEPPGGYLIEHSAEGAGSLSRAGQVVAGCSPAQREGARPARAGDAGQLSRVVRGDRPLAWP